MKNEYAVLGLGESIREFTWENDVTTVGVNDIYRACHVDHLVCVDPQRVFSEERLFAIRNSTPKKFHSDLLEWKPFFGERFQQFERQKPRSSLIKLDEGKICYSICSPYVACIIAYKLGATDIVMYGVDFNSHKTLSLRHKQAIIQRDFTNLYNELKKRNVKLMVGSDKSFLSGFLPIKAF